METDTIIRRVRWPYFYALTVIVILSVFFSQDGPYDCLDICIFSYRMFLPFIWSGGVLTLVLLWATRRIDISGWVLVIAVPAFIIVLGFASILLFLH